MVEIGQGVLSLPGNPEPVCSLHCCLRAGVGCHFHLEAAVRLSPASSGLWPSGARHRSSGGTACRVVIRLTPLWSPAPFGHWLEPVGVLRLFCTLFWLAGRASRPACISLRKSWPDRRSRKLCAGHLHGFNSDLLAIHQGVNEGGESVGAAKSPKLTQRILFWPRVGVW